MAFLFGKRDNLEAFLPRIPLFSPLGKEAFAQLAKAAKRKTCKAGEVIFKEGDEGEGFYVVREGAVEISRIGFDGKEKLLAVLPPPEIFGEMAIIGKDVRSATAKAKEASVILHFDNQTLIDFTPKEPTLVMPLLEIQVRRLRHANEQIAAMEEISKTQERILHSLEEERKRIARDVHDGPTQSVSQLVMKMDLILALMDSDAEKARSLLSESKEIAMTALKEIRSFIFDLHPVMLETKGLHATLEEFTSKWQEQFGVKVELDLAPVEVPIALAKVIFSVTQESLNNIRKYAEASTVKIGLREDGSSLVVKIQDDGKGVDLEKVLKGYGERRSLGLLGMRERAELVGGKWEIASAPGEGTTVTLTVPKLP